MPAGDGFGEPQALGWRPALSRTWISRSPAWASSRRSSWRSVPSVSALVMAMTVGSDNALRIGSLAGRMGRRWPAWPMGANRPLMFERRVMPISPSPGGDAPEIEAHRGMRVGENAGQPGRTGGDGDAEFFLQFADQRLAHRFARFDLAAGNSQ